jgi:hypothetical protein
MISRARIVPHGEGLISLHRREGGGYTRTTNRRCKHGDILIYSTLRVCTDITPSESTGKVDERLAGKRRKEKPWTRIEAIRKSSMTDKSQEFPRCFYCLHVLLYMNSTTIGRKLSEFRTRPFQDGRCCMFLYRQQAVKTCHASLWRETRTQSKYIKQLDASAIFRSSPTIGL